MPNNDLVVLGDSVTWGQGLKPEHKFASLVAASRGLNLVQLAHSGAVIGRSAGCGTAQFPGEVPESCPSILQQIGHYTGDSDTVPLVLLNGGINDINVRTILNPFTKSTDLARLIQQYCYQDMGFLLIQVKAKFSQDPTRIVVTSYFPVLSAASDFEQLLPLMESLGIAMPQIAPDDDLELGHPVVDKVISLAMQFWQQSNAALAKAVSDVNLGTGPRCYFANVPFTDKNSVFAPNAWLFGVNPAPGFDPQDEVVDVRHPQCDAAFPDDLFTREQCYRASAGHPNVTGAQQFAQAIEQALT